MRFTRVLAAAAVSCLALAGCVSAPASTSASGSASSSSSSSGSRPATSQAPQRDQIRAVMFRNLEWTDVIANRKVTLKDGSATDAGTTWKLGPNIVFADANGDGYEDALTSLEVDSGDAKTTYLYIWLWDAAKKWAAQVADPVARYSSCGNSLVSAKPGTPNGFEISEKIRDAYDGQACGTEPLHPFTRTVGVSGGWLVMSQPVMAYGGICYQTYDTPTSLAGPARLQLAPNAAAPVVDQAQYLYPVMPDRLDRQFPSGWTQVGWLTDEMKAKRLFYGICAFYWQN